MGGSSGDMRDIFQCQIMRFCTKTKTLLVCILINNDITHDKLHSNSIFFFHHGMSELVAW